MSYIAALYAGGKVVTGKNHGIAFAKLSIDEQDGMINSGFLDPQTGRFITDEFQFYIKKIILIRHAEACESCEQCQKWHCFFRNSTNPPISDIGRLQCERTANFLMRLVPVQHYVAYSCDCTRTKDTAMAICGQIGIPLQFSNRFCDPLENESPSQFMERLKEDIESLPEHSIIISHSDFVVNMAQIAMGTDITQCEQWKNKIPNCSITYVENHQPIWIGESPI